LFAETVQPNKKEEVVREEKEGVGGGGNARQMGIQRVYRKEGKKEKKKTKMRKRSPSFHVR
jgi:hypothetical protein